MSKPKIRIAKAILIALDQTGMHYEIEVGSRHLKVRVEGRFCTILPLDGGKKSGSPTAERNSIAQIRRVAREIREGKGQ